MTSMTASRGSITRKINHGVNLDGDVVARDHVLRRHLERVDAQRHPHDAVDRREHQDDARALWLRQHPAQAENHAALVLGAGS